MQFTTKVAFLVLISSLFANQVASTEIDQEGTTEEEFRKEYCDLAFRATVPPRYRYLQPKIFKELSGDLQIFTSSQVKCSGFLQSWRFIAMSREVSDLYLAVFRMTESGTFSLVNYTAVNVRFVVPQQNEDENIRFTPQWVTVDVEDPFPVESGDYLGFFYEYMYTPQHKLSVPTRPFRQQFDPVETSSTAFLFSDESASTVFVRQGNMTIWRKQLDVTEAIVLRLFPAVVALVAEEYSSREEWPVNPDSVAKLGPRSPSTKFEPANYDDDDNKNINNASLVNIEPRLVIVASNGSSNNYHVQFFNLAYIALIALILAAMKATES